MHFLNMCLQLKNLTDFQCLNLFLHSSIAFCFENIKILIISFHKNSLEFPKLIMCMKRFDFLTKKNAMDLEPQHMTIWGFLKEFIGLKNIQK